MSVAIDVEIDSTILLLNKIRDSQLNPISDKFVSNAIISLEQISDDSLFICETCNFNSKKGKAAALHKRDYLSHKISGPKGWYCTCGEQTNSHEHSITHQKYDFNNYHRVFRFNYYTLKKSELKAISIQKFEELKAIRIKTNINSIIFCQKTSNLISIKKMDAETCISCKINVSLGGECLPVYDLEVKL